MGFLGFAAIALLLWYTGHRVIDGSLAIGTLTGFLLYGITIGGSLATIAGLYGQFREGTGAVTRVFEILDTEPSILDAPDAVDLDGIEGAVGIDGVSFAYDGVNDVLRDVHLDIRPGEVLALVGPSGSGKTTLVGLLPRLWDVSRGAIRVDGRDVRQVTTASLRARIGLVPQEAVLFGGSVRANIRYRRALGQCPRLRDGLTRRLRHAGGRPGLASVRRPAAADRDRAGDPQGSGDPPARRGDELAGQ
jgi:subfamily B ATP-binding cassette protein MsbA